MFNPYRVLLGLLPDSPLLVGKVLSIAEGAATIELPGGGVAQARGEASIGQNVYFRAGAIEGVAPDLPVVTIEV